MTTEAEQEQQEMIAVGSCEKCGTLVQVIAGPDGPMYRPVNLAPESPALSETRHEDAIMRLVDELASAARDAGWWASAPHMANAATAAEKRRSALREQIQSALTAARAERDQWKKAADQYLDAAGEAEDVTREACAKIAETFGPKPDVTMTSYGVPLALQIANAIRSRSLEGQRDAE